MMAFAVGFVRWWAGLYTAGLPAGTRDERRAEIESDLWEHGALNGGNGVGERATAFEVLGRLVMGVPADVSWRFEQRARRRARERATERRRSMVRTVAQRGLSGMTLLLAALYIAAASGFWFRYGLTGSSDDWDPSVFERVLFGVVPFAALALIVVGLFVSKRSPWLGGALLAVGAVSGALVLFWTVIFPVFGLLLAAFWVMRARRFARERSRIAPHSHGSPAPP